MTGQASKHVRFSTSHLPRRYLKLYQGCRRMAGLHRAYLDGGFVPVSPGGMSVEPHESVKVLLAAQGQ